MRRFRDMPIGWKLTLLMVLVTSVMLMLACVGFTAYNYVDFRSMLIRDTTALAEIVGASSEPALDFSDADDARETLRALHPRKRILGARLFDREGKVMSSYARADAESLEMPEAPEADGYRVAEGRLILFNRVMRKDELLGTVCLVADLKSELTRYFWVTAVILGVLLVASVVVTLIVAAKLQAVVSTPILELAEVARSVAEDKDYSGRANKYSEDETGLLVDTFNEMLDRIEQREEELESSNLALEEHRQKLQDELAERQRAEEALRSSEERFRQVAESISQVFWVVDIARNQFTYISPAYENIWGRSCASLYADARSAVEAIHPEDKARVKRAALHTTPDGSVEAVYRVVRPDGTIRWVRDRAFTITDDDGKPYRIVGIAEDITERREAEDALRDAEGKWRSLVENSRDIITIVDRAGKILFINRVVSGFDRDKVVGTNTDDYILLPQRAVMKAALGRVFQKSEPTNYEIEGAGPDGAVAWYETRAVPITHDGEVISAMLLITDITERKRLEKEVLDISDREQGRIGLDLHDGLCQHLVGTSFAAQLLAEQLESRHAKYAEDSRKIAELIGEAITHARRIARGLYPVQLEEAGLMSALTELAVTVSGLFYVSCEFKCRRPVLLPDNTVAVHLYRIAQEAVNNALKHGKAKKITITLEQNDAETVLAVKDDGMGLPDEGDHRAGMGLRIMAYRARLMRGDFTIRPQPMGGTVITCRVPIGASSGGPRHAI